jgi:hypothetical protein
MKLSEMFPSNLLKAQDVTDAGGEMVLTIFGVEMKEFDKDDGGKENKPVVIFGSEKDAKRMVLNKTNAGIIAKIHGDDTDLWIGKEITLHVEDVLFGNKMTPAIRVKYIDSKQAAINAFWAEVNARFMSPEEGREIVKKNGGDFVKALAALKQNDVQ